MSDTKSDIRLIQLNSYVRPAIIESKSKDWVLNGKNNSFYDDLVDAYTGSTTNSSIINTYADLIYGRGLGTTSTDTMSVVKLAQILSKKDLRKIVIDFATYGSAELQIIKTKGGDLAEIAHVSREKIAPNKENEDGEIETYWFSDNWNKQNDNPPEPFPAFGTSNEAIEIYDIRPYRSGKKYFSDPEWVSALSFCQLEKEQANFYIKAIKQGLSAGYIINVPDGNSLTDEEKAEFERQIKAKLTGSPNALNFILSFNGRDAAIEIVPFPVNEQMHKQWDYLNDVSLQKILTSHRCTSPSIVGVVSSSGFSNTADEMEKAEEQLIKRVILPKQNQILDAIEEILTHYNINLNLFFKPLTAKGATKSESFTGVQISSAVGVIEKVKTGELTQAQAESLLRSMLSYPESEIKGLFNTPVSLSEDLESILLSYTSDEPEGYELDRVEEIQFSAIQNSEQDDGRFKIRYAYAKGTSKTAQGSSRDFCNSMMKLSQQGRVFRKEDIEAMSGRGVNGEFAHSGGKYDIFKFAGGVNCYHRWERRIYKKKLQDNGEEFGGNALQNTTEVNVNEAKRQGAKIPKNSPDVAIAEIDKPNNGKFEG